MADEDVELEQVGPYVVTRMLTVGATSSLYLGKQQQRKRDILIKVFHTSFSTTETKELFLSYAKQLKRLKHRNIVEIYDFGTTLYSGKQGDYGYLVMQYVTGDTLRQRIAPGQILQADEVKRILSPIADALHYAHVNTVLHSNLHPGNLLVGVNNETLLTNFAFALPGDALPIQKAGAAVPYMAPEQLRGMPGAASDQYALAVMVYEWLGGRRPYEASDPETLLYLQEHDPLPALHSLNSNISPNVEHVLVQALAVHEEERFQHTQAFADNYLRALMGLPLNLETKRVVPATPEAIPENSKAHRSTTKEGKSNPNALHVLPVFTPTSLPSSDNSSQEKDKGGKAHSFEPAPPKLTSQLPQDSVDSEDGIEDTIDLDSTTDNDITGNAHDGVPLSITNRLLSRLHDAVTSDLCQGGILSQSLPGYEERPAQVEMATLVARSLTQSTPAIIEAGTGTGKALDVDTPIPTPIGWEANG